MPRSSAPSARRCRQASCCTACSSRRPPTAASAASPGACARPTCRGWTLDSFPFDRQPAVSKAQIKSLAGLDFLRRAQNILLIGKPGTGKTGLAIGLLREACLNGHRGRFYTAQVLLDELYASLADRSTTRLLTQLSRMQPLCIDELGYLTLKPEQANAFFRLMDQRYNRVSTIITTNLGLPDWYGLFDKKPLVDAPARSPPASVHHHPHRRTLVAQPATSGPLQIDPPGPNRAADRPIDASSRSPADRSAINALAP